MQRTETSIEAIRRLTPLDSFTDAQKLAAFAALSEDAQRLMLIGYAVPEWVVWDDLNERQRLAVHLRFVRRLTLDQAAQLMSEHFKSPITRERLRQIEGQAIKRIARYLLAVEGENDGTT